MNTLILMLLLIVPSSWSGPNVTPPDQTGSSINPSGSTTDVTSGSTNNVKSGSTTNAPSGGTTVNKDDDDDDDFGDDSDSAPHQPPSVFGQWGGNWGSVIIDKAKETVKSATGVDINTIANDIVEKAKNLKETTQSSVNKVTDTVKSGQDIYKNGVVVGGIFKRLKHEKELTPKLVVESFALGVAYDFKHWMPPFVSLPDLEMISGHKYMCGEGGQLYNPASIEMAEGGIAWDKDKALWFKYSDKIQWTVTHTFKTLVMYYPKFSQHWMGTVVGRLWLTFANNSVDFLYQFPSIDELENKGKIDYKCSIVIQNITVTNLLSPTATVENASGWKSNWRRVAEKIVKQFARLHTVEFENLFRFGILRAMVDLLKEGNKYICLEPKVITEIKESKMLKPEKTDNFASYCTNMESAYESTTQNQDTKGSEQGSTKDNKSEKQNMQKQTAANDDEFDFK